jgi:hypothetical protein
MPEGNDPKLAETLDAPVYEAPKRGRSLTGFYIGVGIVATLVGLGIILYPHLRLKYAIHQLHSATQENNCSAHEYGVVLMAAMRGNGRAIDALITYRNKGLCDPWAIWFVLTGDAEVRAEFFRQLDRRPDEDALRLLDRVAKYAALDSPFVEGLHLSHGSRYLSGPRGIVVNLEPLEAESLEPPTLEVVRALLDYTRLRFADEFSEERALLDFGSAHDEPRYTALRWLCHIHAQDLSAVSVTLEKALKDPDWSIRDYAAAALKKIRGQDAKVQP